LIAASERGSTVIGTGPFVMDAWSGSGPIHLHKNANYWQVGKPYLDAVTFEPIDDSSERWDALRRGDVDAVQFQGYGRQVDPADFDTFTDERQNPGRDVFALNTTTEPFNDVIARQAVSFAIDRAELGGDDEAGYLSPHAPLFSAAPDAVQRFDPDRARQLAKQYEAKHGHPLSFTMITAPDAQRTVTTAKRQLEVFGITMTVVTQDPVQQLHNMVNADFEAAYWLAFGGPSPEHEVVILIGETDQVPDLAPSFNWSHYTDEALLEPFARYRATDDPTKQRAAMAEVQKVLADQAPWIFLNDDPRGIAMSPHVHGMLSFQLPDGAEGHPSVRPFVGNAWRSP
jgi:peptide/nickel transport system substrate-binding protein